MITLYLGTIMELLHWTLLGHQLHQFCFQLKGSPDTCKLHNTFSLCVIWIANLLYLCINNNNINFKFKCNCIHTFTALANAKLTTHSKVLRLNKTQYIPHKFYLSSARPFKTVPSCINMISAVSIFTSIPYQIFKKSGTAALAPFLVFPLLILSMTYYISTSETGKSLLEKDWGYRGAVEPLNFSQGTSGWRVPSARNQLCTSQSYKSFLAHCFPYTM